MEYNKCIFFDKQDVKFEFVFDFWFIVVIIKK